VCEVMLLAEPFLRIPGQNGVPCRLVDSLVAMEAYRKVTDSVLSLIECDTRAELKPAQEKLYQLKCRQFGKHIGEVLLREDHDADKLKESAARDIIEIARQSGDSAASDLTEADVRLSVVKINYGKKEKNPIDSVSFYHSLQDTEASALGPEHVSLLIPKVFQEKYFRVACHKRSAADVVKKAFYEWWNQLPENIAPAAPPTPLKSMTPAPSPDGKVPVSALGKRRKI